MAKIRKEFELRLEFERAAELVFVVDIPLR
jgi:hypothetical protein